MIAVSDTSAITNLYQIGQLSLLLKLYQEVLITDAVMAELSVMPEQVEVVESANWIRQVSPTNKSTVESLLED